MFSVNLGALNGHGPQECAKTHLETRNSEWLPKNFTKMHFEKKKQYFEYLYAEEISCELRSNLHSDPSMLSTKLKVIVVTYGLKIQNETKKPTNEVQK